MDTYDISKVIKEFYLQTKVFETCSVNPGEAPRLNHHLRSVLFTCETIFKDRPNIHKKVLTLKGQILKFSFSSFKKVVIHKCLRMTYK